jgi:hypothetical protein
MSQYLKSPASLCSDILYKGIYRGYFPVDDHPLKLTEGLIAYIYTGVTSAIFNIANDATYFISMHLKTLLQRDEKIFNAEITFFFVFINGVNIHCLEIFMLCTPA